VARVLADAEVHELVELLEPIAEMDWPIDSKTVAGLHKICLNCSDNAAEALKIVRG